MSTQPPNKWLLSPRVDVQGLSELSVQKVLNFQDDSEACKWIVSQKRGAYLHNMKTLGNNYKLDLAFQKI